MHMYKSHVVIGDLSLSLHLCCSATLCGSSKLFHKTNIYYMYTHGTLTPHTLSASCSSPADSRISISSVLVEWWCWLMLPLWCWCRCWCGGCPCCGWPMVVVAVVPPLALPDEGLATVLVVVVLLFVVLSLDAGWCGCCCCCWWMWGRRTGAVTDAAAAVADAADDAAVFRAVSVSVVIIVYDALHYKTHSSQHEVESFTEWGENGRYGAAYCGRVAAVVLGCVWICCRCWVLSIRMMNYLGVWA